MSASGEWRKPPHFEDPAGLGSFNNSITQKRKRKIMDADVLQPQRGAINKPYAPGNQHHQFPRLKRTKTPRILGQNLPINRLIEVLDKEALQELLQRVVALHPETGLTVSRIAPKSSEESCIGLMKTKFSNIMDHLPYKCDVESDYSYIRIKSYLTEFLNCLSDFVLTLLPPMDTSLSHACAMLDVITEMIHELPNFTNNEFQYTRNTAYEQIANLWLIVLTTAASHNDEAEPVCDDSGIAASNARSFEFIKTIQEFSLQDRLEKHNELSMGRYSSVIEFVKSEMEALEKVHHSLNNNGRPLLSDLISVDYSNYSIAARSTH